MSPEVIADGIFFPEGLAWSQEDQTLLVTSVQAGAVYRVWPLESRKEILGDLGGGANNVALAQDGGALVTQNGGLDAHRSIARSFPDVGEWPAIRPARPGLVHVDPAGRTRYIVETGIDTPNDLVVAPDGTVYFTDPGNPFLDRPRQPQVRALSPEGELRTVAIGFDYCNGIEVEDEGTLLVTDHDGILRIGLDGGREWVARGVGDPAPDGVTVDSEGRIYVAAAREAGVRVLEHGRSVELLRVPGEGSTSNCCFGGPDYTWLFATDTRHGTVVVWTSMPVAGRRQHRWALQT